MRRRRESSIGKDPRNHAECTSAVPITAQQVPPASAGAVPLLSDR